jgi:Gamma-glutamyl cyclotransferase, AIG2-like
MTTPPFLSKLASAPYLSDYPTDLDLLTPAFTPTFYFFYGTLAQPEILSHILDLKADNPLVLRLDFIEGYSLRHWGQYRTLINGPPLNVVEGVAYLVRSEADVEKLAYYETKAYEAALCVICFMDGSDVNENGKCEKQEKKVPTMVYVGDPVVLEEGRFDSKLWVRYSGE